MFKRKYRIVAANEAAMNEEGRWIIRYRIQTRDWFRWMYLRKAVVHTTISPNGIEYSETLTPIAEFDDVKAAERFVVNKGLIPEQDNAKWDTVKEFSL